LAYIAPPPPFGVPSPFEEARAAVLRRVCAAMGGRYLRADEGAGAGAAPYALLEDPKGRKHQEQRVGTVPAVIVGDLLRAGLLVSEPDGTLVLGR
jgi:hypothetical protein